MVLEGVGKLANKFMEEYQNALAKQRKGRSNDRFLQIANNPIYQIKEVEYEYSEEDSSESEKAWRYRVKH